MNLRAVLLSPLLVGVSSCIFATEGTDLPTPDTEYRSLDSPENVLHNLVLAAGNREIARVAELLAPEFQFRFQPEPGETGACATGVLDRDQGLTALGALFADPEVRFVRLTWSLGPAEPSTETGKEGLTRIRTLEAGVEVATRTQGGFYVSSLHEFHFRSDPEAADGAPWLLVEWKEIPVSTDPALMDGPTPTRPTFLWSILCTYSGE